MKYDYNANHEDELYRGDLLNKIVLSKKGDCNFLGFLGRAALLPLGPHGLQSLSMLHTKDFTEPWLGLPSPMLRHQNRKQLYSIKCPNLWMEFPEKNLNSCLHILKDDRKFQRELDKHSALRFLNLNFRKYCESIEYTFPKRFPRLLIDIFNFACDAAQPIRICLADEEYIHYDALRQSSKGRYPHYFAWVKALAEYRKDPDNLPYPPPRSFMYPDNSESDLQALQIVDTVFKKSQERGGKKAELRSNEKYFWDIPLMLEALESDHRPDYVGPTHVQAAKIILEVKSYPEQVVKNIVHKDIPRRRKLDLISPIIVSEMYGLNTEPPDLSNVEAATTRVLLDILFYCGRRARCLLDLKLEDFHFLGSRAEIVIPSSKGKLKENQVLPGNILFPEYELKFIKSWHESLSCDHLLTEKVITLFKLEETNRHQTDKNRQPFAYRLSKNMRKMGLHSSTHLPRHCFASWWPVRCLLANHPQLLNHPLMQNCKEHVWFQYEMLLNLKNHLKSCSLADSTERANRIMGHRQRTEFQFSYCRSWPLLAALQAELQTFV